MRGRACAAASLLILGGVAVLSGCAEVAPKIEQTGPGSEANQAAVMAKIEKMEARIVGVQKEVQTSVKGDIKATRDAVQTTNQNTGMGDWIVLMLAVVLRGADVWETKITKRNGNGVSHHASAST